MKQLDEWHLLMLMITEKVHYKRVLVSDLFLTALTTWDNTFMYPYTAPIRMTKLNTTTTDKTVIMMMSLESFDWSSIAVYKKEDRILIYIIFLCRLLASFTNLELLVKAITSRSPWRNVRPGSAIKCNPQGKKGTRLLRYYLCSWGHPPGNQGHTHTGTPLTLTPPSYRRH